MNKMVNRLRLKRVIVRRFEINDSDEEEEDVNEVQIIEDNKSKKSDTESSNTRSIDNKKYKNYKIYVKTFGENTQRVVETNGDNNPFADNEALDQLMNCKDLTQIESQLKKISPQSHSKPDLKVRKQVNGKPFKSNEFQSKIKELRAEGIHKKSNSTSSQRFKCLVCAINFGNQELAFGHIQSDTHLKNKFGDDLKGIDALFTIDSEAIGDVEIAISRRKQLKKINSEDKQKYFDHGIRLKNGFGSDAYICSSCDLNLKSLIEVKNHLESYESVAQTVINKTDGSTEKSQKRLSFTQILDEKLESEGIRATETSDCYQFYCIFCNIYFECKRIAASHMTDPRHRMSRRNENLNEMDTQFIINSKRIDEVEVAFARKTLLRTLSVRAKTEYTEKYIRLEDGIGPNAFHCVKCDLPIGSVEEIEEHIHSLSHTM